jgi:hypothetical protein
MPVDPGLVLIALAAVLYAIGLIWIHRIGSGIEDN